jgi:predicted dehydrogenase
MTTARQLKLGLVGAGWVAQQHLDVIAALDGVAAAGIVSRSRAKAEQLAEKYKIAVCAADLAGLVREAKPDALMLLVSEDQMFAVANEALKYKLPLFLEKPSGLTPAENLKLAKAAEQLAVPNMVGFNRRYYSIFHQGLEIIKRHGRLLGVAVEGHERMWRVRDLKKFPENVLANWLFANSTHTIDLLRFFGGEVKTVKALAHKLKEARGDQFAAVFELASGALGNYSAHWYSPGGWRAVLYGEGVTVEFKPLEKGVWTDREFKTHEIEPDPVDVKFKPGFYRQLEAFARLVREGKQDWPLLDLSGAYQTMKLAEEISYGPEK